ncbi:MAG TPA: hypothetical protein VI248_06120 [Kineosporiaceae bacterium]
MNTIQVMAELGVAIAVAVAVIRYWRQIVALVVAVIVVLSVIGAFTVLSWFGVGPRLR